MATLVEQTPLLRVGSEAAMTIGSLRIPGTCARLILSIYALQAVAQPTALILSS